MDDSNDSDDGGYDDDSNNFITFIGSIGSSNFFWESISKNIGIY